MRNLDLEGVPLRTTLKLLLDQLDLTYVVNDGLLRITSRESAEQNERDAARRTSSSRPAWADGRLVAEPVCRLSRRRRLGAARLNLAAASAQANELQGCERSGRGAGAAPRRPGPA